MLDQLQLYGRDRQLETLVAQLSFFKKNTANFLLISGETGTGKSTLVKTAIKQSQVSHQLLGEYKCDRENQPVTFNAAAQVLSPIINYWITYESASSKLILELLADSLHSSLALLVRIFPDLDSLLQTRTPQPASIPLEQANSRLQYAIRELFRAFEPITPPCILFIDDIQWADTQSVELIVKDVMHHTGNKLKLVATTHRPSYLLDHHIPIDRSVVRLSTLNLKNLDQKDVRSWVSAYFADSTSEADSTIAQRLYKRSSGNPLLLTLLFESISLPKQHEPVSAHDLESALLGAIRKHAGAQEIIASRFYGFSLAERNIVGIAACIGIQFQLGELQKATNDAATTINVVNKAIDNGILFYDRNGETHMLQFSHSKLQQLALTAVSQQEKEIVYYNFSAHLLQLDNYSVFSQVQHTALAKLNLVWHRVTGETDRLSLARLNVYAAKQSSDLSDLKESIAKLKIVYSLSDELWWQTHSELMLETTLHYCELLIAIDKHCEVSALLDKAYAHANTKFAKSALIRIEINKFTTQSEHEDALHCGVKALALWGIDLPINTASTELEELNSIAARLFNPKNLQHIRDQSQLPGNTELESAMEIMTDLLVPSDAVNPQLNAWLAVKLFNITMQYGYTSTTPKAFSNYASACASQGLIDKAYELGNFAIELCESTSNLAIEHRVRFTYLGYLKHWKDPILLTADEIDRQFNRCLVQGDNSYAALTIGMIGSTILPFIGEPIDQSIKKLETARRYCKSSGQQVSEFMCISALITLNYLTQDNATEKSFQYNEYSESAHLRRCEANASGMPFTLFRVLQSLCFLIEGKNKDAYDAIESAFKNIECVYASFIKPVGYFVRAVAACRQLNTGLASTDKLNVIYQRSVSELKVWADANPTNFSSMHMICRAEWQNANESKDTLSTFQQVVLLANSSGNPIISAMAHAQISNYWHENNNDYYQAEHSNLCCAIFQYLGITVHSAMPGNGSNNELNIDFTNPWSKSAHPPSVSNHNEQQLEQLLRNAIETDCNVKSMQSALEMIAEISTYPNISMILVEADKHILYTNKQPDLHKKGFKSIQLKENNLVPSNLIKLVLTTRKTIHIQRPFLQSPYSLDKYFISANPETAVCFPVIDNGTVLAIFYLESDSRILQWVSSTFPAIEKIGKIAACIARNNQRFLRQDQQLAQLARDSGLEKLSLEENIGNLTHQLAEQEKLKSLIQPQVIDVLLSNDKHKYQDGHRQNIGILFCDLRNFTEFSEQVEPEELFDLLGNYHQTLGKLISKHNAIIDHRAGDGLMAFIGDPTVVDNVSLSILEMATDFRQAVTAMLAENQKYQLKLGFGIGISSGYSTVGLVGGSGSRGYSATGRHVNLASRLCDVASPGEILMSETIALDLNFEYKQFQFKSRTVDVKGYSKPATTYSLIQAKTTANRPTTNY